MGIRVDLRGFAEYKRVAHNLERNVRNAAAEVIQNDSTAIIRDAKAIAPAYGRQQARAGRTLKVDRIPSGAVLRGGGGRSLGAIVFKGSEYGGRRRRKSYVSRRGNNYFTVLRRRTTMQFHPFLGQRGYFFWPSVRTDLRGIRSRIRKAIVRRARGK